MKRLNYLMKASTITTTAIITGYLLVGCSVGYITHKRIERDNQINLDNQIKQQAKDILDFPDLSGKLNLNNNQNYETPPHPILNPNRKPGWLYNHRATNH